MKNAKFSLCYRWNKISYACGRLNKFIWSIRVTSYAAERGIYAWQQFYYFNWKIFDDFWTSEQMFKFICDRGIGFGSWVAINSAFQCEKKDTNCDFFWLLSETDWNSFGSQHFNQSLDSSFSPSSNSSQLNLCAGSSFARFQVVSRSCNSCTTYYNVQWQQQSTHKRHKNGWWK